MRAVNAFHFTLCRGDLYSGHCRCWCARCGRSYLVLLLLLLLICSQCTPTYYISVDFDYVLICATNQNDNAKRQNKYLIFIRFWFRSQFLTISYSNSERNYRLRIHILSSQAVRLFKSYCTECAHSFRFHLDSFVHALCP